MLIIRSRNMTNVETKKAIYTEEFYETLKLMINAEDLETYNYKSTRILSVLEVLREVYDENDVDKFLDEVIDGMKQARRRLIHTA